MRDLATAAGVSHGLVFHYFGDKRGYYRSVLQSVTDRLVAATAPSPELAPAEQLRHGLRAHVRFATTYPDGYAAIVLGANGADPDIQEICEDARTRSAQHILQTLGPAGASAPMRIAVRGWQGLVEGCIAETLKHQEISEDRLIKLMADALPPILHAAGG